MNVLEILFLSSFDVIVEQALHHLVPLERCHLVLFMLLEYVFEVLVQELCVAGLEALLIRIPVVLNRVITATQKLDGHV